MSDTPRLAAYCSICGDRLATVERHKGTEVSWEYHHTYEADHEPKPAPAEGDALCDFCGGRDPLWTFTTRMLFAMHDQTSDDSVTQADNCVWDACGLCKRLVVERNLTGLVKRANRNTAERFPNADAEFIEIANGELRDFLEGFFRAKPGKPKRIKKDKR